MAVNYSVVEGTTVGTTSTLLYTAPSTVLMSIVRSMQLVNTDTVTARQCTIWKIPTAGATNSASMVRAGAAANTIGSGLTEAWDTVIFVAPSGKVYGSSDAASVMAVHMAIVEVS